MKKKMLSILLSLAMVVTMMPAMTMTAFATTQKTIHFSETLHGKIVYSVGERDFGLASGDATVESGSSVTIKAVSDYGYKLQSLTVSPDLGEADNATFIMPEQDITVSAQFKKIESSEMETMSEHTKMLLNRYSGMVGDTQDEAVEAMSYWFADPANECGVVYVEDLFTSNNRYAKDLFYVTMLGLSASLNAPVLAEVDGSDFTATVRCIVDHFVPLLDTISSLLDSYIVCFGEEKEPDKDALKTLGSYIKQFASERRTMCAECILADVDDENEIEKSKACFKFTKQYVTDGEIFGNSNTDVSKTYENLASCLAKVTDANKTEAFKEIAGDYIDRTDDYNLIESVGFLSEEEFGQLSEAQQSEYFDKVFVGSGIALFKSFNIVFNAEEYNKQGYVDALKAVMKNAMPLGYLFIDVVDKYNDYYTVADENKEDLKTLLQELAEEVENFLGTTTGNNHWEILQDCINGTCNKSRKYNIYDNNGTRTIKLLADIKADDDDFALVVPEGKKVVLDLNGHVLDRGLIAADGTTTNKEHGSVIEVAQGGELTVEDSKPEIEHNFKVVETGNIAGLWVLDQDGTKTVKGGIITGGMGTKRDEVPCYDGGGIYVTGTLNLSNGNVVGNSSDTWGGGIYVNQGTLNISDGSVIGNIAEALGGGVYVSDGQAKMSGGAISDNTANENGGGIFFTNTEITSTFVMTDGTISNNFANGEGAGVFVEIGGFKMLDGLITDNTANEKGGGIIICNTHEQVELSGGTISNNEANLGGGIYAEYVDNLEIGDGMITGNTANDKGGGVYMSKSGNLKTTGGIISENTATGKGGGVYIIESGASFEMSNGLITKNTAGEGGGVYVDTDASMKMSGGSILENTATTNGGGVYISGDNGEAKLTVGGVAKITNNTAGPAGSKKANNLYLPKYKDIFDEDAQVTITIGTGEEDNGVAIPKSGMSVGVSMGSLGKFATNGTENDIKYFFSDDESYYFDYVTDHIELKSPAQGNYAINVIPSEHGAVSTSPKEAAVNDTVTLTVTPDGGYELNTLTVQKSDGSSVEITSNSFTMPNSAVTVKATFKVKVTPVPAPTDEQKFGDYKTAETSKLDKLAEEVTSDSDKAIVATAKADLEALKYDSTKTLAENKASARSIVEAAFVHVDKVVQNTLKAYKNGKIKVSWKALTLKDNWTVDSYQVYRKVKGGKYKRVATVKLGKKKTITYTNTKKLKKGKKYYYKVRGKNLLSDGTYAYTKWSKVKSIKCKKTRK